MKSYLEIKVPITFDAPWFVELRNSLKGMPVLWQRDYYHITMVFIDDTQNLPAIKAIMNKYLDNAKAITITFDKLDVFATRSGMLVVRLTTSSIPQTFQTLVNDIQTQRCNQASACMLLWGAFPNQVQILMILDSS